MNAKLFFQALLIFICLVAGWFAFYFKLHPRNHENPEPNTPQSLETTDESLSTKAEIPSNNQASTNPGETSQPVTPPASWKNWIEYLSEYSTPENIKQALENLKTSLSQLSQNEQIEQIRTYLNSKHNLSFPLSFQVGPEETPFLFPDLRTFLIQLWYELNPQQVGQYSLDFLKGQVASTPAEQAIHLRNVARMPDFPNDQKLPFLRAQSEILFDQTAWIESPNLGFLYALNVINESRATNVTSDLANLLDETTNPMLRRTANLTLDRLVILEPLETLSILTQANSPLNQHPKIRAGFVARANPANPMEKELIESYFSKSTITAEEKNWFLDYLPNLNLQQSYDLLNANIEFTPAQIHERLNASLQLIDSWIQTNRFPDSNDALISAQRQLLDKGAKPQTSNTSMGQTE